MEKWSLTALADGLLRHVVAGSNRYNRRTVDSGHSRPLHEAMIALCCGQRLDERYNSGETTVQVLRGRVRVSTGNDVTDGTAGELLIVPAGQYTVTAVEDTVVLLTAADRTPLRDATPANPGPRHHTPARATASPDRHDADRAPTTFDREMNP